ncbi:MAG: glutathione S-transferase family protein, partial [Candidatus Binatia bacterium]
LTPLTGGYRRIPVMQIGADVWCDTAIIAQKLEELAPEPTMYPQGQVGAAEILANWADHWLFLATVPPALVKLIPVLPAEFMTDRAALSPGFTTENVMASLPDAKSRLVVAFEWLEAQLGGRQFLLGDAPGLADAAVFHPLWFLRNDPESFAGVERRPALRAWFERIEGLGVGSRSDLSADEAIAIARAAEPATSPRADGTDPDGITPGEAIVVSADDYGSDPVSGEAAVVTAQEIAVRRRDPQVGDVVVHFPRAGYRVRRAH